MGVVEKRLEVLGIGGSGTEIVSAGMSLRLAHPAYRLPYPAFPTKLIFTHFAMLKRKKKVSSFSAGSLAY